MEGGEGGGGRRTVQVSRAPMHAKIHPPTHALSSVSGHFPMHNKPEGKQHQHSNIALRDGDRKTAQVKKQINL